MTLHDMARLISNPRAIKILWMRLKSNPQTNFLEHQMVILITNRNYHVRLFPKSIIGKQKDINNGYKVHTNYTTKQYLNLFFAQNIN